MLSPNDTPSALLAGLVRSDPTRPRLTWYDDHEGATQGERIELSGRVLANWTAKAANLLQDDLDIGPGSRVALDLPAHWRAAYWLFAIWSVGAEAVVGGADGSDVVITSRPSAGPVPVVAVTLAGLARAWAGDPLPSGAIDEAKELATYGDRFEPWATPGAEDVALSTPEASWTYGELVPSARASAAELGLTAQARVMTSAGPQDAVRAWLGPWSVDGSLVLFRNDKSAEDDAALERRASAERVTHRLA